MHRLHGLAWDPFRAVSHCSARRPVQRHATCIQLPSSEGDMAPVTTSTGNYTIQVMLLERIEHLKITAVNIKNNEEVTDEKCDVDDWWWCC